MFATLIAALIAFAPTSPVLPPPIYTGYTIDMKDGAVDVTFPDEKVGGHPFTDHFVVDTGADMSMMASTNLSLMAIHGHAHLVSADFFAGVDGKPDLYPIYVVDRIKIGDCLLVSTKDRPLLFAGAGQNLLGQTVLTELQTYSVSRDSFTFNCP